MKLVGGLYSLKRKEKQIQRERNSYASMAQKQTSLEIRSEKQSPLIEALRENSPCEGLK
jgi:hypothetical protein